LIAQQVGGGQFGKDEEGGRLAAATDFGGEASRGEGCDELNEGGFGFGGG